MSDAGSRSDMQLGAANFPLTRFIVALMKKPLAERLTADPQKAADGYGLPLAWTRFYIEQSRQTDDQWPIPTRRMK